MQVALVKETLDKLDFAKDPASPEEKKQPPKELEVLLVSTKKIDKNSIHALTAVLPASRIHTLKFSNNGLSQDNFDLLANCIAVSPASRLFFEWNPVPIVIRVPKKKPGEDEVEEPPPPYVSPYVRLYPPLAV